MNCELSGYYPGLLRYYKLNQGIASGNNTSITNAIDESGNNQDATLTNFGLTGNTANFIYQGGVTTGNSCAPCTVNIPDANFKAALLANGAINTNNDGEIQCSEAAAFGGTIWVANSRIADLTGIEAFVNITQLYCQGNQLTSLNVSSNTALTYLSCGANQFTSPLNLWYFNYAIV